MKALLPALLCVSTTVALAAPEAKQKAKLAPPVAAHLYRVANAYTAEGDFSVATVEFVHIGGKTDQNRYTGRFATDGRRTLQIQELDAAKRPKPVKLAFRFDGAMQYSYNGVGTPGFSKPKNEFDVARNFYGHSVGLTSLSRVLGWAQNPDKMPGGPNPSYQLRTIAGGRPQLLLDEPNQAGILPGVKVDLKSKLTFSPDGFFESIAIRGLSQGKVLLQVDVEFSRPTRITAKDAFEAESVAPQPR